MALSTQPYKGARDFYPEDKRLQKYMFSVMRKSAEQFGYEEYDAPILEPLELFLAKTGEEIVNEQTYTFQDRGERQVAIRPEMTPSVSRLVAGRRQELTYPLRWYSIPNLWRYERPQRGRLREHWQLNVDLFGIEGLDGDLEIIELADHIMQSFRAKRDMYVIKLNSRRLMNSLFYDYLKLSDVQSNTLGKLIDRMHKLERGEFLAQADALLSPSQREDGTGERMLELLSVKELNDLPDELYQNNSVAHLKKLLHLLKSEGVSNAVFDITLMRGFDYYTDIVFEVFDTNPDNNRSMFGGGRYDGLVGLFGVDPVPTVGFGMGDVTLQNFLDSHGLLPQLRVETDLYVIIIGDVYAQARPVIKELRQMGLKIAVDLSGRSIDKQIKTASKKGIHNALFIGEHELAQEKYMLKNLLTGEEGPHSAARIVSLIKDYRKQ
jgi:histidyl-tRNA synthetase